MRDQCKKEIAAVTMAYIKWWCKATGGDVRKKTDQEMKQEESMKSCLRKLDPQVEQKQQSTWRHPLAAKIRRCKHAML